MDFLNECSQNLDKAIDFINSSSHEDNDTRLYYIDLLDKQIMKLDTIEDRNNRKLYILATQNILSQLESLYKKEKQIETFFKKSLKILLKKGCKGFWFLGKKNRENGKKKRLKINKDKYNIFYFGDKYLPSGNDYILLRNENVTGFKINKKEETFNILKKFLEL